MKVVIATPILFDKNSPFNHLFRDILKGFIDAGFDVTRIVAVDGSNDDSYKMDLNEIHYILIKRKKIEKSSIIKRYLIDSFTTIKMARYLKRINADILFEDVSYSSRYLIKAAKRLNMKVVSMFQDVWPDNAVQSNLIKKNSLVYKFFNSNQKPVFKLSDSIICISDDMKKFLETKMLGEKGANVIYNWGYSDDITDISFEHNAFVKKYNFSADKFYAVYAGNIGRMQNVQLIIHAAKILSHKKDICFLIIGDGVLKQEIEQLSNGMDNISILPYQPSDLATSIYSMADVNIIPLVKGGIKTALPSKTGIILSCGKPVVVCFDADSLFAAKIDSIENGYKVSPDDPNELADAILDIYKKRYSNKNYALFNELFNKKENVQKYVNIMKETYNEGIIHQ